MDSPAVARVGIVGLGTIGRIHAERVTELGHELVAAADICEAARASFEADFDAETYATHEELIGADVDAIFVTTPNRYHEDAAVAALEAGLDVLLEKPLAHTLESAERIAAAARRSDGRCEVGFTMRYSDLTREVVRLRDEGELGDLSHIQIDYLRRSAALGSRSWFTDPEIAGGGVLIDLGVHIIDLALYLLDYPDVIEVSGIVRTEFGSYEVEDSATALLRCADGRSVSVETSWTATCPESQTCTVRGTDAGVSFTVTEPDLTLIPADDGEPETIQTSGNDMHQEEDREFLELVVSDEEPAENTVEQALLVQRIIDAVYESSEKEAAVSLTQTG